MPNSSLISVGSQARPALRRYQLSVANSGKRRVDVVQQLVKATRGQKRLTLAYPLKRVRLEFRRRFFGTKNS